MLSNWQSKVGLLIAAMSLSFLFLSGGACAHSATFDERLSSIVRPYTFSTVQWELVAIPQQVEDWLSTRNLRVNNEIESVNRYFSLVDSIGAIELQIEMAGDAQQGLGSLETELAGLEQEKAELAPIVERTIGKQVRQALDEQGIFNPITGLKVSFPPLNFRLAPPPDVLVVSPRDMIESLREITLKPSISLKETEAIETQVDQLNVSSLVVPVGGFSGAYPTFVSDSSSLEYTLDAVAEEWLHQYLVFKPLGFLYLLDATGVSPNYDIATMNETVASMVSKEIASAVYVRYYGGKVNGDGQQDAYAEFNREMREIRRTVDDYLARGDIDRAERFMEERRQYLLSKGYHIRKLNQAYFAFYGTYADSPTSISPIGLEMRQLRDQSASLKDFLNRVSIMASPEDLKKSVQ